MLASHLSAPPTGPDAPIEQLVRRSPIFVHSTLTLRQVAEVLATESVGAVLVETGGRLAGLLSERDVVTALADGADADAERVADVMADDLETVPVGMSVRAVAERMLDDEIRHVPIVDGDAVVGVVSMRDVVAVLVSITG